MKTLVLVCLAWFLKCFMKKTLPELYYDLAERQNVSVKQLRKFEKLVLKVCKLRLDEFFFERCLGLNVVPRFLNCKVPKLKCLRDKTEFGVVAMKKQLKEIQSERKKSLRQYDAITTELNAQLTLFQGVLLKVLVFNRVKLECEVSRKRHENKLQNLWIINNRGQPNAIVNRSSRKLSFEEEVILSRGLKNSILPKKLSL